MKLSILTLSLQLILQAQNNSFVSAFTSPLTKARAFTSCSKLNADPGMSSLLREYSASVVTPSASKIASSVPPPPETIIPTPEVVTNVEATSTSVTNAAAAAQSAANEAIAAAEKATAAASEIVTPTMKSTISATAGLKSLIPASATLTPLDVPPVESGKVPTLVQFLKYGGGQTNDSPAIVSTKEKFDILQQNVFGTTIEDLFKDVDYSGIQAGLSSAKGMTAQISGSAGGIIANNDIDTFNAQLKLEENGAWYLSGILLLVAIQQRNAGKSVSKKQYEKELSIAKAKADEAAEAAIAAAAGAKAAKELAAKIPKATTVTKSEVLLETTKYEQMRIEKEMMRKEMERMIQETALLRKQLSEISKQKASTSDKVKLAPAVKEVMKRDPQEDARILQILKDMDDSNATTKKPATKKRKVTKKKANDVVKSKTAVSAPKKVVKKVKKAVKKAKVVAEKPVEVTSLDNPWASLSESTLKRKTVKQLTEYLEERKIKVTDESGKIFKKADLVTVLQSL